MLKVFSYSFLFGHIYLSLLLFEIFNSPVDKINKQTEYAVACDLIEYLPVELYPQDIDSVEFVIRLGYDYQGDGWYSIDGVGDITAIKEYAKIVAEQSASRKQLYAATPFGARTLLQGYMPPRWLTAMSAAARPTERTWRRL